MAINSGSPNKVNAYRLLKYMLSDEVQSMRFMSIPINNVAAENIISEHYIISDWHKSSTAISYVAAATPQGIIDDFYAYISNIKKAVFTNKYVLETFILPEMQGYFDGTDSFENCHARLKNKLTLYLDE